MTRTTAREDARTAENGEQHVEEDEVHRDGEHDEELRALIRTRAIEWRVRTTGAHVGLASATCS